MAKNINTRIILKHDTETNWNKAVNFIPNKGEVIIYDIDENFNYERVKIGDGVNNAIQLPFINDNYLAKDNTIEYTPVDDYNPATKKYVESTYERLKSNTKLGFYCIEDVTVITNGISKTYPSNSNVEINFVENDVFEIVPTSDNSILSLTSFPGALGTYYSWLEGVKQFTNILFDMNTEDMYTKWSQGNQGAYQVQFAQYSNCIFWSDNPYISDVAKRTNYTLCSTSQLPLCYSSIPDNTFKTFYLALGVINDPNWSNPVYKESFAKATWATQAFSYYGARVIGTPEHFTITLPKDCRGLMFYSRNTEAAGTFDATNVTNFGAKSGSWRDAFGYCSSLRRLYISNLKVNLNISWSPIDYDSIYYIISKATNTNAITISVSPYTYNLLSSSDFELATSKNITIELVTTNYVEDKRLSDIAEKLDKTQGVDNVGKVMTVGEDGIITAKELPTQIQSDWNQNDENQLDFIKNKPFYKIENPNPILFEGDVTIETITSEDGSSYIAAKMPNFIVDNIMNSGSVYNITINETVFENQSFLYTTTTNSYSWYDNIVTVSYLIDYDPELDCYVFGTINATEGDVYSLKIEDTREYLYKFLDEEFLPKNLGRSATNSDTWVFGNSNSNEVDGGHGSLVSGRNHTLKSVSRSIVTGYGNRVETSMYDSVLAGNLNEIDGDFVSVFGRNLIGHNENQHLIGKFNIEDTTGNYRTEGKYVHIVGNGESDDTRSNAHTLDWDGNAEYQGDVKANACGGENPISLVETYNKLSEKITSPTTATVGQVLSVKAVDENNTPTEWETTSIPTKVSELENDSGFLTEQIQPDWNQNDETAKDHIKNRTHYTYNAKTPILEANGLIIDSDGGFVQIGTLDSMLTIGETYYVTLNDITYECVAREYNDDGNNAIIGNGTIYGDGNEGNGEPFSCDSYTDGNIYLNAETAGTYNIKIEAMRETIKQLDEKYIADIVARIYNDMAFNISSSSIRRFTTYIDVSTNEEYIVYVDNGTLVSERKINEEDLIDFTYTVEPDGSYTLLTWKGTLNGEPSTEIVIPNSVMINLIQEVK